MLVLFPYVSFPFLCLHVLPSVIVLEIDTVGTFNCTKAAYEVYMKDHGGVVVNLSATLHYSGTPLQAHAGSAKAAIGMMYCKVYCCF